MQLNVRWSNNVGGITLAAEFARIEEHNIRCPTHATTQAKYDAYRQHSSRQ
jgi:hypothetical protein